MNETTLTQENLREIFIAMAKIDPIDRSLYFTRYFLEIQDRMEEIRFINYTNNLIKQNERNK
jgi:hypothetical protein